MIETLTQMSATVAGLLWTSPITLCLLLGAGAYLTVRLGCIQIRGLAHAVSLLGSRGTRHGDEGEVSPFQALSTVLSATVGTGNIAGVATAIAFGGPGALFWMWVTAVLGMATKFTECTLALHFREIDVRGVVAGGPMYTLARGLGLRRTGTAFALCALIASFGIGNMVQANSVVDGLVYLWPQAQDHRALVGMLMAAAVGAVILGGVKRIANVASVLVPFMAALYIGAAIIVLLQHLGAIPAALLTIVGEALSPQAAGGAAVGEAMRWGVARGLFSNEAGLGSSPMAFAATRTREPVRAGLVAMLGPFVDTLIICTLTGLVIVVTGAVQTRPGGSEGAALTAHAFSEVLGAGGGIVVGIGLALFAYSTMIAWSYYGDRCSYFLFGETAVRPYRMIYTAMVAVGAVFPLHLVWNIADITNLLMAVPNLIGVILLSGLVSRLANDYWARRDAQH
ncbi:MAG: sodium:alanine symporter family protein [Gammaproteobacteria bacterium]|nr:sodium:alanine symporter family protein [Gammaproteobacteria bacterium]